MSRDLVVAGDVSSTVQRQLAELGHLLPAPLDPHALDAEARAALARNKRDRLRDNSLKAIVTTHRYWCAWYALRYGMEMPLPLSVPTVLQFLVDHAGRGDNGRLAPQLPAAMDAALVAGGFKARRRNPETRQWEPVPWGLSTLKLRTGALSMLHTLRGLPNPFTDPEVRAQLRALTKIARDAGQAPKGQKAATLDVVQAMVAACEADGSPQAVRDRALLWLGFSSGGRRRSEIAGALLSDLEPDGRDYYFLLRNSKTNQTGAPEVKPVFGLAAHALTQWLTLRGTWAGPLFCRLDAEGTPVRDAKRSALSDEMVRLIVLKWAERAGVDVRRLSAHSLRSGYLTQAGKDGIPILEAMSLSGHKTFQMVARYYRQGDLKKSKASWIAGEHPTSLEAE